MYDLVWVFFNMDFGLRFIVIFVYAMRLYIRAIKLTVKEKA